MNRTMESLTPWANAACGIDWDGESPVVVCARRHRGRLMFEPLTVETVIAAVKADPALALACALPTGRAMAVWLQTPLTAPAKARHVLPTLLDMAMPFALEDCLYAFSQPVRTTPGALLPLAGDTAGNGLAALAVAARRDDVAQWLATLSAKDLNPHILDHEGIALWTQSLRETPADRAGTANLRAIVWVRSHEAVLVLGLGSVFWSAHRIADTTAGTLERTIRVQLDTAAGGRYAQTPLMWMWGGSDATACQALRTRVEASLPGRTSVCLPHGSAFLARALAERALRDGPLQFNLRREALEHPGAIARKSLRQRRRAAGIAALAAVLLALNSTCEYSRARQLKNQEDRFMAGIARVAGWAVPARGENALLIAQRELEARQAAWAPVTRAFAPSLLEALETVLQAAAAENATVHSLRLRRQDLALLGHAPTRTAAEALSSRLGKAGYATEISPLEQAPEGRFGFRLENGSKEQP